MSESRHTPGPWRAIALGGSSTVVSSVMPPRNDRRTNYSYAYQEEEFCIATPFMEDNREIRLDYVLFGHDDARLIAAAPDLLDTLENLVIGIGMGWDLEGLLEKSQEAINKARGVL